jgi:hypothetical protein
MLKVLSKWFNDDTMEKFDKMLVKKFSSRGLLSCFFICLWMQSPLIFAQQEFGLLFREDWKQIPAETPVNKKHLMNQRLDLHLFGAAMDQLKKSHHPEIPNDPFYIWSGTCEANWAMALSHRDMKFDLSAPEAKITWRSRQSGFRVLRVILELNDGTWLISEEGSEASEDWEISNFNLAELHWRKLDINGIYETQPEEDPDLSHVLKVGVTDGMRGGISQASSRLDWIEVYGNAVK